MPVPVVTLLGVVMTPLLEAAVNELIDDEELARWVKLGINVVRSGVNVEARLEALKDKILERLEQGESFGEADFDAIVAAWHSKDQRWADL